MIFSRIGVYFFCFIFSIHLTNADFAEDFFDKNDYFIMRHQQSGLVLDVSDNWLALQPFTGFSTQLWKLVPARKGTFYIVNKNEGKVLDTDSRYSIGNSWVMVNHKIGINSTDNCPQFTIDAKGKITNMAYCQEWYIHFNGVLVNACGEFAVTIKQEEYKAGVYLETDTLTGKKNQKFDFQYV